MRLRSFEARWAETVGRALLPPGILGGVLADVDLGERFRRECLEPPWYSALLLRLSLWLVWFAPLLLLGRLSTFGGLEPAAREGVLERLLVSDRYPLRMAALFLKLSLCTLLLGDERALARIGAYDLVPRRIDRVRAP